MNNYSCEHFANPVKIVPVGPQALTSNVFGKLVVVAVAAVAAEHCCRY